ncbi:MAG: glycosyltransferase family 2 protein [Oscillospiraceae bacterium]|jgi:glycosyltransferase involved in cell wall biosynthesis|nr:glycosyltransferase family 2 protein [Oscillospiraceae bacterium]
MGATPMVSVVIPVYNIEEHLRQCLDSVAVQTLGDIEIICVDDGSTDSSAKILDEYAEKDVRFHVIHQENAGPGSARNRGMEEAAGRYLIFLDSDDWFEPDFLEKMVKHAEEILADVTICRAVEFDTNTGRELSSEWMLKTNRLPDSLTFSPRDITHQLFRFTWGWPWDKLYRREYLTEGGFFYPDLPNSEDLSFVFLSLAAANRISVLDITLVHHRVNRSTSVSNSRERYPEAPYQAIKLLEMELKQRNLYTHYEQEFLNWAMDFLIWNTASMKGKYAQDKCFSMLKEVWIPEFHFQSRPIQYYRPFTGLKYMMVRLLPQPAFYGCVRVYYMLKETFK